jgi:hypothetical protein
MSWGERAFGGLHSPDHAIVVFGPEAATGGREKCARDNLNWS